MPKLKMCDDLKGIVHEDLVEVQSLNCHTDVLLDFKGKSGERIFSIYWKLYMLM